MGMSKIAGTVPIKINCIFYKLSINSVAGKKANNVNLFTRTKLKLTTTSRIINKKFHWNLFSSWWDISFNQLTYSPTHCHPKCHCGKNDYLQSHLCSNTKSVLLLCVAARRYTDWLRQQVHRQCETWEMCLKFHLEAEKETDPSCHTGSDTCSQPD